MNFTGEQGRVHIPSPYVNSRVTSQEKRSTIVLWEKNPQNIIVSLRDRHRSVPAVQLDLRARLLRILSLLKHDSSRHKLLFGMMVFFPFFTSSRETSCVDGSMRKWMECAYFMGILVAMKKGVCFTPVLNIHELVFFVLFCFIYGGGRSWVLRGLKKAI